MIPLNWYLILGAALFLLLQILATVWNVGSGGFAGTQMAGTPESIGRAMFTDYVLPFEAASLLILIALMGAIIFAKKDL